MNPSDLLTSLAVLAVLPHALAATYFGCYTDPTMPRALNASTFIDFAGLTVETCERYCSAQSLPLFGLEYGGECYCGIKLEVGATSTFSSQCSVPCTGNKGQTCGGFGHLSLYGSSAFALDRPIEMAVPHPEASQFEYVGCFAEKESTSTVRALGGASVADQSEMTVFGCARFCLNRGFLVFGVEFKSECYCGTAADKTSLGKAPEIECDMPCSGAEDQLCGGSSRIGVFQWYDARSRGGKVGGAGSVRGRFHDRRSS
jgi:hypothetical protein